MYVELPPRPDDFRDRLDRVLLHTATVAQRRIDDMVGYATTESCRHGYISAHFGSPPRTRCTVCDNCTGVHPAIEVPVQPPHLLPDDADIEPMIIDCLISLPRPVGRSGLARILVGALRAPAGADKARHFGALKGLGESSVVALIDDLLEAGQLRQFERQGYLVLVASLQARAEAEAWLAEHPELNVTAATAPEPEAEDAEALPAEKYTALQKALWLWRRRVAEELGQPTYVVMSNELMLRIAETRPTTLEALETLPGMGAQRLQHYGAALLDLVKLNPPQPGDEELLLTLRAELVEVAATGKAAAGQIRAAAEAVSPQLERKILLRLQELRQKRAVPSAPKRTPCAPDSLLRAIAHQAPQSLDELHAIPGFRTSGLAVDAESDLDGDCSAADPESRCVCYVVRGACYVVRTRQLLTVQHSALPSYAPRNTHHRSPHRVLSQRNRAEDTGAIAEARRHDIGIDLRSNGRTLDIAVEAMPALPWRIRGKSCAWSMTPPPMMMRWGEATRMMLTIPKAR